MFENGILEKMFGPKKWQANGGNCIMTSFIIFAFAVCYWGVNKGYPAHVERKVELIDA